VGGGELWLVLAGRGEDDQVCGDEGGRSAVAGSLVWEKKLGKMGCVWGVFGCVAGKEKWSCGLGEGEKISPVRGRRVLVLFSKGAAAWKR